VDAVHEGRGVTSADGRAAVVLAPAVGVEVLVAVGVAEAVGVSFSFAVPALTWAVAAGVAAADAGSAFRPGSSPVTR
jgi:hypothetical protein